jgi:AbrB family looped-hinge helix DNA binding protein
MSSATITSKGQITIPKAIRDQLPGRVVEFVLRDGEVLLRPVESAAGSLAEYAPDYVAIEVAREAVWGKKP